MTIVADEEVLTAAELDLAVDSLDDAAAVGTDVDAALAAVAGDKPFLIIEKGAPTDEEIAALVCVLSAAAAVRRPRARRDRTISGAGPP